MISFFNITKNNAKPLEYIKNSENRSICCIKCLNEITNETLYYEKNNSHIHSFSNPYGYIYTIRCFSDAPGTITTGQFSDEFSWFQNYMWKIALCKKCKTHVGWMFRLDKNFFFGLVTEKIT